LNPVTRVDYKRHVQKDGTLSDFSIEIVPKRVNDTNIVAHNPIMLKYCRSNCNMMILFSPKVILNYITKYQTKSETKSDVFKTALVDIFNTSKNDNLQTRVGLRQVMTKVLGERDVSRHECLYLIMDNLNCYLIYRLYFKSAKLDQRSVKFNYF
jgi:hypothetical protein